MNIRKKLTALCAAMALLPGAASAYDILHVANATSADYQTFVTGRGDTWTHTNNGTGAGAVGGDLDRITDFAGLNGGTGISVREYLERFDLIVIGNGIGSGNFDQTADWAALTKPVLVHTALVARASSTGVTTDRMALFSGGQGDYTYGVPNDTVRVSVSALGDAIFDSVITPTDLYAGTLAPASPATTTYGSGELIASLTNGTTTAHGIAFWEAGDTIAGGQIVAANRGFMAMRNANNSIVDLTADGRIVLGNLIDQLLVETEVIFLAPTGVTAKSGIGEIILDWTATTGAVSYNIKRSATPGGPYTTVSTAGTVTDTTYTDTGLVNDTVYYYVISAVNGDDLESPNSVEVSAFPVDEILPGINILYIATANNASYQNFATNGKFVENTWTHKPVGTGLDGVGGPVANQVGGDLSRTTTYTGFEGETTVSEYMNGFDLVIVGVPTGSASFIDGNDGALWAELTVPLLFHSPFAARALNGRVGLFSGDNAVNPFPMGTPDTARVSMSALSDAILADVVNLADLYAVVETDTINGAVALPNAFGNGEQITSVVNGAVAHRGVVFWAAGATLPVLPPEGLVIASNRAYMPLKGGIDDLNADGKTVVENLIAQLQVAQTVPPPLLTIPTDLVAEEDPNGVFLYWTPSVGAVSHDVKRATAPGGPYTIIAPDNAGEFFTDTTVENGIAYYYVVSATAADDGVSANSNEATITLGGATYQAWIDGYQVELPDPADRLPGADPDDDGKPNFMEFALNGNPANGSNGGMIATLLQDSSAPAGNELTLVFAARRGAIFTGGVAAIDGIVYSVEGSAGLVFPEAAVSGTGPFDNAPAATGLPGLLGTSWEYHIFKLDASEGLAGKGFLRLKTEQPDQP